MELGLKGREDLVVTEDFSAKAMGSGNLAVFATPAMVALMEKTAWKSVQDYLEEGQGTVGTLLEVRHLSATPLGMRVSCESELVLVDGRKLGFVVKVFDEVGLIGEGRHERFVIDQAKFQKKTDEKLK